MNIQDGYLRKIIGQNSKMIELLQGIKGELITIRKRSLPQGSGRNKLDNEEHESLEYLYD